MSLGHIPDVLARRWHRFCRISSSIRCAAVVIAFLPFLLRVVLCWYNSRSKQSDQVHQRMVYETPPLTALCVLSADAVSAARRVWLVLRRQRRRRRPKPRVLRVYTVRNPTIEGVVEIISQGFRTRHPDVTIEFIYGDGSYSETAGQRSHRQHP
jgi:hypothetical protein